MTPKNASPYGDAQRWADHYEVFPRSGVYSNRGERLLVYGIEEYWYEETVLAFVELGDAVYVARSDWYDRPLVFQKWDLELRRYDPLDLLNRPWVALWGANPLEWLSDHEVEADRMELRIGTTDGGKFVFDLTTGAVISSNRGPAVLQDVGFSERELVARISQSADILSGTRDWRNAADYFAKSMLVQCSDVESRSQVEQALEELEQKLGDQARYLFQLFDIESANRPLRGVVRLEHNDSDRFDLYRIPYGQACEFLCGNRGRAKQSAERQEPRTYASIMEIKLNPERLKVALALGLVKPDWNIGLPADNGLIVVWMQDPNWRIAGLTVGKIRFPGDEVPAAGQDLIEPRIDAVSGK